MSTRYGLSVLPSHMLTGNELTKISQDTVEKVAAFTKAHNKEALLISVNGRLLRLVNQFQDGQVSAKPKTVAKELEQADIERDQALKTVIAFVRAHAYIRSEPIKLAYDLIDLVLKDYRKIVKLSYEAQSSEVTKLLLKLKQPAYQQAITALGLSVHIANLETAQAKFETLYQQRLREQATANPGKAKVDKKTLEKAYKLVVDLVAINATAQPDHAGYQDLLKQVNVIRSRYKKRGKKGKEKGEEPSKDE